MIHEDSAIPTKNKMNTSIDQQLAYSSRTVERRYDFSVLSKSRFTTNNCLTSNLLQVSFD